MLRGVRDGEPSGLEVTEMGGSFAELATGSSFASSFLGIIRIEGNSALYIVCSPRVLASVR